MSGNKGFHVFVTVVAHAYVVSVNKFRKLVTGRKEFHRQKFETLSPNLNKRY